MKSSRPLSQQQRRWVGEAGPQQQPRRQLPVVPQNRWRQLKGRSGCNVKSSGLPLQGAAQQQAVRQRHRLVRVWTRAGRLQHWAC